MHISSHDPNRADHSDEGCKDRFESIQQPYTNQKPRFMTQYDKPQTIEFSKIRMLQIVRIAKEQPLLIIQQQNSIKQSTIIGESAQVPPKTNIELTSQHRLLTNKENLFKEMLTNKFYKDYNKIGKDQLLKEYEDIQKIEDQVENKRQLKRIIKLNCQQKQSRPKKNDRTQSNLEQTISTALKDMQMSKVHLRTQFNTDRKQSNFMKQPKFITITLQKKSQSKLDSRANIFETPNKNDHKKELEQTSRSRSKSKKGIRVFSSQKKQFLEKTLSKPTLYTSTKNLLTDTRCKLTEQSESNIKLKVVFKGEGRSNTLKQNKKTLPKKLRASPPKRVARRIKTIFSPNK